MESEDRTAHASQIVVQTPTSEIGREPGIDPGTKNPMRLLPVVSCQALELPRPLEIGLGGADAGTDAIIDETLCGFRHYSDAAFGQPCCCRDSHRPTDAVSERDQRFYSQRLTEPWYYCHSLVADKCQG